MNFQNFFYLSAILFYRPTLSIGFRVVTVIIFDRRVYFNISRSGNGGMQTYRAVKGTLQRQV